MIILDTNVLGALMRTVPDAAVVAWVGSPACRLSLSGL